MHVTLAPRRDTVLTPTSELNVALQFMFISFCQDQSFRHGCKSRSFKVASLHCVRLDSCGCLLMLQLQLQLVSRKPCARLRKELGNNTFGSSRVEVVSLLLVLFVPEKELADSLLHADSCNCIARLCAQSCTGMILRADALKSRIAILFFPVHSMLQSVFFLCICHSRSQPAPSSRTLIQLRGPSSAMISPLDVLNELKFCSELLGSNAPVGISWHIDVCSTSFRARFGQGSGCRNISHTAPHCLWDSLSLESLLVSHVGSWLQLGDSCLCP